MNKKITTWYIVLMYDGEDRTSIPKRYSGVGGKIWPLSDSNLIDQPTASELHRSVVKSNLYRSTGLCSNFEVSLRYYKLSRAVFNNVKLLEVSLDHTKIINNNFEFCGYDFGRDEGGYSCIVNDFQTSIVLSKYLINNLNCNFLFDDIESVNSYVKMRSSINAGSDPEIEISSSDEILRIRSYCEV